VYNSAPSDRRNYIGNNIMPQRLRIASSVTVAVAILLALALIPASRTAHAAPASPAGAQPPTTPRPGAPPAGSQSSGSQGAAAEAVAAQASSPSKSASQTSDLPFLHGKADAGATKAAVCAACHGPNGNSANPEWPRLAGQSAVYIAEQLRLFRSGVRNNPVMKPLAAGLSDQDIDDLAVYFEAQTPAGLEADPSYWQAGEALYLRGDTAAQVPACVACHGPVGRGNLAAGYPALRAQQSVYVVAQLKNYANGSRYSAANPATASRNGVMMFTIAKRLTPEQMRDVASYVQGMR
jgi:cytochrome c553